MARVIKRVAAKRDLTDHFVFLGENASERYLIFYRPLTDGVEILRVVDGARYIERLFR